MIVLPDGAPRAFDIGWVDTASHRYYVAVNTHAAVEIFDTTNDTYVGSIGGFVGFHATPTQTSGPDGVLVIPELNQLWAGDGDSTVKVVDLATGTIIATVSTGGQKRADELAYDPIDNCVIIANDDDTIGSVVATITQVGGSDELWYNPTDNHYYVATSGMTSDGTSKGTLTPVIGIIDAGSNQWIQNVPTIRGAHSVAVDPTTNHIYVPMANVGIAVYSAAATPTVSRTGRAACRSDP
ncbi:MAG: YncE family protein [Dehalococcoidia bacterium]